MVEADSPSRVSNDELVENCLILVQQLFAEELINDSERDHLKGNIIKLKSILAISLQAHISKEAKENQRLQEFLLIPAK